MTEKQKDRMFGSLYGTVSGIIVVLVGLFWGNKMTASQEFNDTVAGKADQVELEKLDAEVKKKVDEAIFIEYKNKNELSFKELKLEIKTEFKEDLQAMEKRLNRESDMRDKNMREFIKAVVDK